MERSDEFIQTIAHVEDMTKVASDIVSDYCAVKEIEEDDIPPQIWNDIIDELYIKLFKPCNRLLKTDNNLYNQYDVSKVEYIYINIYRRLCNSHCQEISQKGFLDMTGIGKQTLYDWAGGKLSTQSSDLQQKIMDDNEQSLEAMLHDKRINPMKVLPSLNKKHGWNLPGVSRESANKQALTAAELPQLGQTQQNTSSLAVLEQKTGGTEQNE